MNNSALLLRSDLLRTDLLKFCLLNGTQMNPDSNLSNYSVFKLFTGFIKAALMA
jgi:hypothetical protein